MADAYAWSSHAAKCLGHYSQQLQLLAEMIWEAAEEVDGEEPGSDPAILASAQVSSAVTRAVIILLEAQEFAGRMSPALASLAAAPRRQPPPR